MYVRVQGGNGVTRLAQSFAALSELLPILDEILDPNETWCANAH